MHCQRKQDSACSAAKLWIWKLWTPGSNTHLLTIKYFLDRKATDKLLVVISVRLIMAKSWGIQSRVASGTFLVEND